MRELIVICLVNGAVLASFVSFYPLQQDNAEKVVQAGGCVGAPGLAPSVLLEILL